MPGEQQRRHYHGGRVQHADPGEHREHDDGGAGALGEGRRRSLGTSLPGDEQHRFGVVIVGDQAVAALLCGPQCEADAEILGVHAAATAAWSELARRVSHEQPPAVPGALDERGPEGECGQGGRGNFAG